MTRRYPDAVPFFAGTFNPFTIGHADIVERALALFGSVVIGVGINAAKDAEGSDAHTRVEHIQGIYRDRPVTVTAYSGLTTEAAQQAGATLLLRGVRSVKDYEYELSMAEVNRRISGLETLLLPATPELAWVSSSVVRELAAHGRDVSALLP